MNTPQKLISKPTQIESAEDRLRTNGALKATTEKPSSRGLSDQQIIDSYRLMLLMRRFEETAGRMYQMRKFMGFCHLYIGQEAVAAGAIAALQPNKDYIFTTYRDHAWALGWGLNSRECMAELFMKFTGCSKGKGGSMHFFNGKTRFMGGNGIVGGHIPLAAGAAWGSKARKDGAVSLCIMGDAAVNQGTFHETLNMASLWNLPVVFMVENNIYGMGTAVERSCAQPDLFRRTPEAYRIRGVRADGMDMLEMYEVVKEAADRARSDGRPTFIEAVTYRFRGHSMSDPATTYRNKDEVGEWQLKDPLLRLQAAFPKLITEELVNKFEEEIRAEVDDSVKFAEESEFPPLSEIFTDVYVNCQGYPDLNASPNTREFDYSK